ncbi:putative iron sulfur assembly protein [Corynascus novoguineensis]|uniref:Iron sulfur assembly protein n=1 Tax=Corynascus novoguineensis TaxID=1126955 RepID=A0AAN7D0B6_9PEZI|nr:putative iron sulfur assembly protein [Corynascus novoguineensis]
MPRLRCVNAPATASVFIQLSMRRHVASGGLTILDLLLPASFRPNRSLPLRPYHHVSTQRVVDGYRQVPVFAAQSRRPPWSIATSRGGELSKSRTAPLNLSCQTFSTSFTRRATHAIFNPQVDDEGNEMMLEITPRAAKRLSEIMAKDSNPNLALRIQVESGGCHGFQYLMKLVTLPPSLPSKESLPPAAEEDASAAIREDDTIFTYVPDDNSSPGDLAAPKIILDFPSLELLKGSKVDFTMELIGSQFKIVDNPLATSSCGCGTSFDIKI